MPSLLRQSRFDDYRSVILWSDQAKLIAMKTLLEHGAAGVVTSLGHIEGLRLLPFHFLSGHGTRVWAVAHLVLDEAKMIFLLLL